MASGDDGWTRYFLTYNHLLKGNTHKKEKDMFKELRKDKSTS